MDMARFKFSHATPTTNAETLVKLREVREPPGQPLPDASSCFCSLYLAACGPVLSVMNVVSVIGKMRCLTPCMYADTPLPADLCGQAAQRGGHHGPAGP
jgi:hypothetical protein